MSFDLPTSDTVYIEGLPPNTTEASLAEYFGSIGIIKLDRKTKGKKVRGERKSIWKVRPTTATSTWHALFLDRQIWLYRDKVTGQLKGDGTVSYEDPFSAASAIEWFHKKEWQGQLGHHISAVRMICWESSVP